MLRLLAGGDQEKARIYQAKDGMNVENPFYAFISLVATDNKLQQVYRQQENAVLALERLVLEQETKQRDIQGLQVRLHELKKQLHAKELELQLLQDRVRTKRHKLDQIASPREYLSLQNELAELEKSVAQEQDIVLHDMVAVEEIMPRLQDQQAQFDQYLKEYELKCVEIKTQQEKLEQALEALMTTRVEQEKLVYPPLLEQYETMKQKIANPAMPVVGGACGGCFYTITAQELNMLKRHKIVHCAECYRLLYILE